MPLINFYTNLLIKSNLDKAKHFYFLSHHQAHGLIKNHNSKIKCIYFSLCHIDMKSLGEKQSVTLLVFLKKKYRKNHISHRMKFKDTVVYFSSSRLIFYNHWYKTSMVNYMRKSSVPDLVIFTQMSMKHYLTVASR